MGGSVLMLGVSLLQELEGVPDRLAVEMLRYHAGWNFALNRQLGEPVFHPSSLVNFRHRLTEHDQSALGFTTILEALEKAGLVSRSKILRALEKDRKSASEIARESSLTYECVSYHLVTMREDRLVERLTRTRPFTWGLTPYGQQKLPTG